VYEKKALSETSARKLLNKEFEDLKEQYKIEIEDLEGSGKGGKGSND